MGNVAAGAQSSRVVGSGGGVRFVTVLVCFVIFLMTRIRIIRIQQQLPRGMGQCRRSRDAFSG